MKITHIACMALFGMCMSCSNVLDIKPRNILSESEIFSSETGLEAYMASLYNLLPIEDFNLRPTVLNYGDWTHFTDESMNLTNYDVGHMGNGTASNWWGYNLVRNVNNIIDKIDLVDVAPVLKNSTLGEAKFIRAYAYFAMVKRYGGVPLITSVQEYTGGNLEELRVKRNTEQEVYDFIARELDEAAQLLGSNVANKSRANKYTALALKSRAMVYAASIAQFGSVQLDGIVGIPNSLANNYWQAAYDAAKAIIDDQAYSLYEKNANKAQNFTDLFLDINNPEAIFVKYFQNPDKTHAYDSWNVLLGHRAPGAVCCSTSPTIELVEKFEYIDGSDGALRVANGSQPIMYENPTDLFKDKDPRLEGTVIFPFGLWKGDVIDIQAGLIDDGNFITSGDYDARYNPATGVIGDDGIRITGLHGMNNGQWFPQTGFYVKKYLDPNYVNGVPSTQAFIDFRFGEVLLNYAEAAVELGRNAEAAVALNRLRMRAGIAALSASEAVRARVRNERTVELAFEGHRFWDIRRWRIAATTVAPLNTVYQGLFPYFDIDEGKYVFYKRPVGLPRFFHERMYYEMIPPTEIARNTNLIQNPQY